MGNRNGCLECFESPDYVISIRTGDTKGAGLHNSAHVIFINERNEKSHQIQLSGCCITVFKRGRTDKFPVKKLPDFGRIKRIIIEQHREQNEVEWFIEYISVKHITEDYESESIFPIHRWLRVNTPLEISEYDSTLPQYSDNPEQRTDELKLKRHIYGYKIMEQGLPPEMKNIPRNEVFSNFYKWDVLQKKADLFRLYNLAGDDSHDNWKSFEEIEGLFKDKGKFRRPLVLDEDWASDSHFGRQRLKGCNSKSLKLCKKIPENFDVTPDLVEIYLEGFTLDEALEKNLIFIVNHSIMDGIYDSQMVRPIPSPMALFYLTIDNDLVPIAIQLFQKKSKDNPVFVPNDPHYTWLMAKIWFNNADSIYHRACLLFASSHWLLEMITISVHRQLSPSHPVYKLMMPFLRLVLPINHFGMHPLLRKGGWIDQYSNMQIDGYHELIKRFWKDYKFNTDSDIQLCLEENQVFSPEVIEEYPFRDDCFLLRQCFGGHIYQIIEGNYREEGDLLKDHELQAWAAELVSKDSCNLNDVPGNGQITNKEDLVQIVLNIIFKATVEHAALSLPMYDECAFVPNYPLFLRNSPPTSKESLCEADIMETLPSKHVTLEILLINKAVSERGTSGIADSRALYAYDPITQPAREKFLGCLRESAATITKRNRNRKSRYDYLNPASTRTHFIPS